MSSSTSSIWSARKLNKVALVKSSAIAAAALIIVAPISTTDGAKADAQDRFDREQTMLLNLQRQPNSTGFFLVQSNGRCKEIVRDLARALRQLEEVDKAYAKSRGKPDSRYLEGTKLKMINAGKTAERLHDELWDTFQDLKKSISNTLVIDESMNSMSNMKGTKGRKD